MTGRFTGEMPLQLSVTELVDRANLPQNLAVGVCVD